MHIVMAMINSIPPHVFWGFQLSEWVQIIGIITFISGIVIWIVRLAIVNPTRVSNDALRESIDTLSRRVEGIGGNADKVHEEHDKRLDRHDVHLARHDEEIKTLFQRTHGEENK